MTAPILATDAGGERWFLEGRPIHCGAFLWLRLDSSCTPDGAWASARWELEFSEAGTKPVLYLWAPTAAAGAHGVDGQRVVLRDRVAELDLRWHDSPGWER